MTRVVFHVKRNTIPSARRTNDEIDVWLYGESPPTVEAGSVGAKALDMCSRLSVPPSKAAVDLLSIAMAVTAADTFISRDDAADGWSREFEVRLPLSEPQRWIGVKQHLEEALRFLSNDQWSFEFVPGGVAPPRLDVVRRKRSFYKVSTADCVSLFSGGLDSAIGALDLLQSGKKPLFVSHAPQGDATYQEAVLQRLPTACQRIAVNTYPTWAGVDDDSMRTRSFQFIALGVVAAQAIAAARKMPMVELFVCENGFIALNPPLTPRRISSHSTRTAHPYFLAQMTSLLAKVGLPVVIRNPYEFSTKGEMAAARVDTVGFKVLADQTVSCGKWKRRHQQCGRCVPCLVRRAALYAAQQSDGTSYEFDNLSAVLNDEKKRDDLFAVQSAILRVKQDDLKRLVLQAGPLPEDSSLRERYFDVARRGFAELEAYLQYQGVCA